MYIWGMIHFSEREPTMKHYMPDGSYYLNGKHYDHNGNILELDDFIMPENASFLSSDPDNLRVETYKSEPLTREQIEGEGWEVYYKDKAEVLYEIFIKDNATMGIRFDTGDCGISKDKKTVFSGTISNIHQFRTLMQMLDIK